MDTSFVNGVKNGYGIDPEENVFAGIWSEYERVIIESLITSFGLDSFIKDQHGGDVDTIHNVREIGKDPQMQYKNAKNKSDYDNREAYDNAAYHSDEGDRSIVHKARKEFEENGTLQKDAYVDGNMVIPRNNDTIPREKQGQLDHVVPAEEIANDPGRVLAGLDGKDLANCPENLRYTNAALNNKMRSKSVEEYIKWCEEHPDQVNYNGKKGEPLPENVKENLRKEYNRAKKENKGFLDPEEFKKKLIDNYTKHYRYRATRTSIIKLKLFLDFLCNRKGNTLSSQFMWPENSNPILSPTVVRFMRKCSEEFDKRQKKK